MKVRKIKELLEVFYSDEMKELRETLNFINDNCPFICDLKAPDCHETKCNECWIKSLNMKENQGKLDNKV